MGTKEILEMRRLAKAARDFAGTVDKFIDKLACSELYDMPSEFDMNRMEQEIRTQAGELKDDCTKFTAPFNGPDVKL